MAVGVGWQPSPPGTGVADGVGLGLAIAQGFLDTMGGRLELDDTPGGGLTATLVLPAAAPGGGSAEEVDG